MKKLIATICVLCISNFTIAGIYKIAFGSCLDQDYPQPIWDSIKKENINSFVFLGDNVYGDVPSGNLIKMKDAYKKQKEMLPKWLYEKDIDVIWDDHDFGINDGGSSYPLKKEAQKLYLDFWNISSNDIRRSREGIYINKIIQSDNFKINLILLDTRYFRSDLEQTKGIRPKYIQNDNLDATVLGDKQWLWLGKTLKADADLIIIATSIQLLATNHRFEKWSNFPNEHKRLKKLLNSSSVPVLIISGDRHQGAIYEENNLIEITSSSLNKTISSLSLNSRPKESDDLMIGDMFSGENFGLITVDTNKKSYKIEIKDLNGNQVRAKQVFL